MPAPQQVNAKGEPVQLVDVPGYDEPVEFPASMGDDEIAHVIKTSILPSAGTQAGAAPAPVPLSRTGAKPTQVQSVDTTEGKIREGLGMLSDVGAIVGSLAGPEVPATLGGLGKMAKVGRGAANLGIRSVTSGLGAGAGQAAAEGIAQGLGLPKTGNEMERVMVAARDASVAEALVGGAMGLGTEGTIGAVRLAGKGISKALQSSLAKEVNVKAAEGAARLGIDLNLAERTNNPLLQFLKRWTLRSLAAAPMARQAAEEQLTQVIKAGDTIRESVTDPIAVNSLFRDAGPKANAAWGVLERENYTTLGGMTRAANGGEGIMVPVDALNAEVKTWAAQNAPLRRPNSTVFKGSRGFWDIVRYFDDLPGIRDGEKYFGYLSDVDVLEQEMRKTVTEQVNKTVRVPRTVKGAQKEVSEEAYDEWMRLRYQYANAERPGNQAYYWSKIKELMEKFKSGEYTVWDEKQVSETVTRGVGRREATRAANERMQAGSKVPGPFQADDAMKMMAYFSNRGQIAVGDEAGISKRMADMLYQEIDKALAGAEPQIQAKWTAAREFTNRRKQIQALIYEPITRANPPDAWKLIDLNHPTSVAAVRDAIQGGIPTQRGIPSADAESLWNDVGASVVEKKLLAPTDTLDLIGLPSRVEKVSPKVAEQLFNTPKLKAMWEDTRDLAATIERIGMKTKKTLGGYEIPDLLVGSTRDISVMMWAGWAAAHGRAGVASLLGSYEGFVWAFSRSLYDKGLTKMLIEGVEMMPEHPGRAAMKMEMWANRAAKQGLNIYRTLDAYGAARKFGGEADAPPPAPAPTPGPSSPQPQPSPYPAQTQ